jgi:hypothetical protein
MRLCGCRECDQGWESLSESSDNAALFCANFVIMPDAVDIFADGLQVFLGAYGCALHFTVSTEESQKATSPDQTLQGTRVATVRITPEFAKGMVFFLRDRVLRYEAENGTINMPPKVLERLVGEQQASWDRLWAYTD